MYANAENEQEAKPISQPFKISNEEFNSRIEFVENSFISGGAFGFVYKCKLDGKLVAVKEVYLGSGKKSKSAVEKGISLWKRVGFHKNIVTLIDSFIDDEQNKAYFFMEYATGGTLSNYLEEVKEEGLTIKLYIKWSKQICEALSCMHTYFENPILHRDLKTNNILINAEGDILLTDFDFIRDVQHFNSFLSSGGAPAYTPPEEVNQDLKGKNNANCFSRDIYALGYMFLEMFTCQKAFDNLNQYSILYKTAQNERPAKPSNLNPILWEIIELCWHQNAQVRPTAFALVVKFNSYEEELKTFYDEDELIRNQRCCGACYEQCFSSGVRINVTGMKRCINILYSIILVLLIICPWLLPGNEAQQEKNETEYIIPLSILRICCLLGYLILALKCASWCVKLGITLKARNKSHISYLFSICNCDKKLWLYIWRKIRNRNRHRKIEIEAPLLENDDQDDMIINIGSDDSRTSEDEVILV